MEYASMAAAPSVRRRSPPLPWSVDVRLVERERILRGWSRSELARTAHVDPKTVGDLVGGRRQPNLGTVQALCTALGLALQDVIRFERGAEVGEGARDRGQVS